MEIRQLKQFIAVAQAQSFSRAAQTLFMAQPPLSIAIKKLEEEVGAALFKRTHRGVELTSAGEAALSAAIKCVKEADNVLKLARAAGNGETGVLRVGFIGSLNFSLLPSLIRDFLQEHPGVLLQLQESTNEGLLSMVESEAIDLAFVRSPTSVPKNCTSHLIAKDVLCAALPAQHPLAHLPQIKLEDFRNYPFIGYTVSRVGGLFDIVQRLFHEAGFYPDVVQEAIQVQTVVGLVRSGLGISLIPSAYAAFMPQDVVFKKLQVPAHKKHIGISITHLKTNQNPALAKLIQKLTEYASLSAQQGSKGGGVAEHSAF